MIFSEYSEVWERLIFARLYLFSRIKRSPIFSGDWGVSDTCLKCYKWFQLKQSKVLLKKNSGYLVTSLKLFSKNFPSDLQYYGEGNLNLHAAKSLQSCPTLCDPMNGSPPGSFVPGILQARTLEWVAISFSNAWKWKGNVKSLCRVRLLATPWTAAYQAPPSMGFSWQEYWSGVPSPSPIYIWRVKSQGSTVLAWNKSHDDIIHILSHLCKERLLFYVSKD